MPTARDIVEELRQRLFIYANKAREARLDHDDNAFSLAAGEVMQTLALLREQYRVDSSSFGDSLLEDIRTCKICAGIITREQIDREAEERADQAYQQEVAAKHQSFLASKGIPYAGMRVASRRYRETHCHCHRAWLDSRIHLECKLCRGIICYACGGCLCGASSS